MTIHEIADYYSISRAHLTKVVHNLAVRGYIETVRGRSGGIRLARRPELVNVGEVIRDTEENIHIAECFGDDVSCRLLPSCVLKSVLSEARKSFLATLDRYWLSDLMGLDPGPALETPVELPKSMAARLAKSHAGASHR